MTSFVFHAAVLVAVSSLSTAAGIQIGRWLERLDHHGIKVRGEQ